MSDMILGGVTAYSDAVKGGYTGTREQWEAEMANLGNTRVIAEQKAQEATAAAQRAETAASSVDGVIETVTGLRDETQALRDEVMQQESSNKQDKDLDAIAGNVAVFDNEGNTVDSDIHTDDVVVHPGVYDDLNVGTAKNLEDIYATPVPAEFGHRTTAGKVSISEHGTATIMELRGRTEIPNQIVPDDAHVNKMTRSGSLTVTDALARTPHALELRGASLVRNQLVANGDFGLGTYGWSAGGNTSLSALDNELTIDFSQTSTSYMRNASVAAACVMNHTYIVAADINAPADFSGQGAINIYDAITHSPLK